MFFFLGRCEKSRTRDFTESAMCPPKEVAIGEWIVVTFQENKKVKNKKFLGKIKRVRKGRFLVDFVRTKMTRDCKGYIYSYPLVKDVSYINFNQIEGIVCPPTIYQKGLLKFKLHCNVLNV